MPLQVVQGGCEKGTMGSIHNSSSLLLLPTHTFSCSNIGSPWATAPSEHVYLLHHHPLLGHSMVICTSVVFCRSTMFYHAAAPCSPDAAAQLLLWHLGRAGVVPLCSSPSSLTLVFMRLFLTLSLHSSLLCGVLSSLTLAVPRMAARPSCALWWGHWSQLDVAQRSPGISSHSSPTAPCLFLGTWA